MNYSMLKNYLNLDILLGPGPLPTAWPIQHYKQRLRADTAGDTDSSNTLLKLHTHKNDDSHYTND